MSNKSDSQNKFSCSGSAGRDGAFDMLSWLSEGASGVASELKQKDFGLSQAFWSHSHNARREGLLAARALLDQIIARGEECSTTKNSRM